MTDFSRECARLWLAIFGRRFACANRRKDVGRRFPEKLIGSLKHVRVQHNEAVVGLLAAAAVDEADRVTKSRRRTIFGFRRRAIEQTNPPPVPGKKMSNFLRRTQAIATEKARHRVWTACEGVPRLRPKAKAKSQLDRIRSVAVRLRTRRASASPRGIGAKRREPSSLRSTPAAKRKTKASSQSSALVSALASSQSSLPARNHVSYRKMTMQLVSSPAAKATTSPATVGIASAWRPRRNPIALAPDIVQQYKQRMKHKTKKKQQKQAAKSAADTVRTLAMGVC